MTTKESENFDDKQVEKIKQNVKMIKNKIELAAKKVNKKFQDIKLMAVTKNVAPKFVNIAIEEGINLLGENRVQEFKAKYDEYKKEDVKIHFIGHLQSRKVKEIINIVDCIQSVDSLKLAELISKHAANFKKTMPIFLEINIGLEENKFGFTPDEIFKTVEIISKIPNIKINGLMSIPPKKNAKEYFKQMHSIYIDISDKKIDNVDMQFLSMGMSSDFEDAILNGANIVRIGSLLFKNR